MAKSKMKQVAKILGVELGEEFKIKGFNGIFKLTNNGLYDCYSNDRERMLYNLLTGEYEIEQPILDKIEKRYLENFLRPFKDRVVYVEKLNSYNQQKQYLFIHLDNNDNFALPFFKKNSMYKGMKLNKEYTLKELGWIE